MACFGVRSLEADDGTTVMVNGSVNVGVEGSETAAGP